MSTGTESGFCNLECWCHVPTRGINKPPCYLCVINRCSLSSKPDVAPSAPELSPSEETVPIHFSSSGVNGGTPTTVEAFPNANRYGWRATIARNASLILDQRPEDTPREFPELYVQLPPEGDVDSVVENRVNSQEIEFDDVVIPEPDYPGVIDGDYMAMEENQEETGETGTDDNNHLWTSNSDESNSRYVTTVKVNYNETGASQSNTDDSNEGTTDLAELIKSLVCDSEQVTFADDDEDELSERRVRPSTRSSNDRNKNSRRRRDKYQGFYSPGLRTLSDPTVVTRASSQQNVSVSPTQNVSVSPTQNVSVSPTQKESEYQLLHKIHRRDTSTDAARRYLQSDENLHRTWVKEVAVRRRNFPKRHRSSKRFEEGNHRCAFNYEGRWTSLQRQLSRDQADTS